MHHSSTGGLIYRVVLAEVLFSSRGHDAAVEVQLQMLVVSVESAELL